MKNPLRTLRDMKDNFVMASVNRKTLGGGSMKVNPLQSTMLGTFITEKKMTMDMYQNMVWYQSDVGQLQYFYNIEIYRYKFGIYDYNQMNYFWHQVTNNPHHRKLTSGLAPLASSKMADITVGNGYDYNFEHESESVETPDKDRCEEILDENKFDNTLQEFAETASWSGGGLFKIIANTDVSDKPIIELVQPEYFEIQTKFGRPTAYIFKDYFNKVTKSLSGKTETRQFVTHEIYGMKYPHAYIDYELYEVKKTGEETELQRVPLETFEDTAALNPSEWANAKNFMCVYIPNKAVNNRFRGSIYGESDYLGAIGYFDAIDEMLSTMIREYRDAALEKYIPEVLLLKNEQGNLRNPDDFDKSFKVINGDLSEGSENKIEYQKPSVNINDDEKTLEQLIQLALNTLGLSPSTVGMSNAQENTNADAQREREKTTLRTAKTKKTLWRSYFEKLIEVIMIADDLMNGNQPKEYDVSFSFNDYLESSTEQLIDTAGTAIENMTATILDGQNIIHGDNIGEEEKQINAIKIKLENNMNLLPTEEVIYTEYLKEQGIEVKEEVEEMDEETISEETESDETETEQVE